MEDDVQTHLEDYDKDKPRCEHVPKATRVGVRLGNIADVAAPVTPRGMPIPRIPQSNDDDFYLVIAQITLQYKRNPPSSALVSLSDHSCLVYI